MKEALNQIQSRAQAWKDGKHSSTSTECGCDGSGIITEFRWVAQEGFFNRLGEQMMEQVAQIKYCKCKHDKMFEKNNATVGMKESERAHTFETAEIDDENQEHYKTACDFIRNIENHREIGSWMYIYADETRVKETSKSAYGTGKSYLMQCIGNALTKRKIPAIYVTEDKLFQDIKDTYSSESAESESDVLNRYYNVPILLIDDLFTAQYKDWAEAKLYSVLNTRKSDNKITIITSNYAPNRIRERLPLNGAKISSRIIEESILIEMVGKDRRLKEGVKKAQQRRQWSQ